MTLEIVRRFVNGEWKTEAAEAAGGGAQPAGSDGEIQFNDGGTAFGASPDLVWDGGALKLVTAENGTAVIEGNGVGVQVQIIGAAGDATHVGGEVSISSGASQGQGGGDVSISAGGDTADADGGNILILSGTSVEGDGGEVAVRAHQEVAGFRGGGAILAAGTGAVHGGNVTVQAGGPDGNVQMYAGDTNQAIQLDNNGLNVLGKVGFYGVVPVAQPGVPVTLGDVIAALQALGLVAT